MSEENKAFVRRWIENITSGNHEAQKELIGPGHQFHFPMSPEPLDGAAHLELQRGFLAAMPDLEFIIEDQIAEGDKVTTRFKGRGTHQGEFQGIQPTGNIIEFTGINIIHVVEGKNMEEWEAFDALSLMQQLGVLPMPNDDSE